MASSKKAHVAQPVTIGPGSTAGSTSKANARVGNLKKRMKGASGREGMPK